MRLAAAIAKRLPSLVPVVAACLAAGGCVIHQTSAAGGATPTDPSVVEVGAGGEDDGDLSAAMATSLPDGFLVKSTRTAVIQPDAPRDPVRFESSAAESLFLRALDERKERGAAVRERSTGGLPLLWATEDRAVLSDNAFFNEQAREADRDRDGTISDEEAREYAAATTRLAQR